ncbi:MAG: TRAP transporter small permease subunit [Alphaproteobacteria bacterium]|nr:TRAP transporter small permease subunit [Alphaproteobacteria bacterium]
MQGFLVLSRAIDAVTRFIGYHIRWLILAAVTVSAGNAIIRKAFDISSNAWLELQWLLFGAVFMLAAAYTLQRNAHVRIDVISSRLRKRTRDIIDLVCHLVMLAPIAAILIYLSFPFFLESLASGENSPNAGGLIVWPSKLLIFAGFTLLFAQMISEVIKRVAVLSGAIAEPETQTIHGHDPKETAVGGGHGQ